MLPLLFAFAASFALTLWVVRSARNHASLSGDHDVEGPQKFHAVPVPRIGGVSIFGGVLAASLWLAWREPAVGTVSLLLLACGLIAFVVGMAEDLTKRVRPSRRLLATAASAALAVWLVDAVITRTAIVGLDWVVTFVWGAAAVTVFVVTGVANSINIIDGFNGLASMCVAIMLGALAYVGFAVGDVPVALMALAGLGAVLGFFVWNFPAGLVFLGDGGAYFLGFYLAELAILLLHRNPQVSPMFPLLLCFYPVFETLFSMYRRRWLRGRPVGMPDGVHLHSLIYRRFLRWAAGERSARELTRRNSMTSPYLWMLCMMSVVPAVLWWDDTTMLRLFLLLFGLSYLALYWSIVRFRSPKWLLRPRRQRGQRRRQVRGG